MVMRGLRTAVCLAVAVTAAGCYDTPTVAPYPSNWLIDDFEGESGHPKAFGFEPWECRPQDTGHPIDSCEVIPDPDASTNKVLHLGAKLYPYEDGGDTFTRAEVATFTEWPQDLTSYAELELWAKLSWEGMALPNLKAQLSCIGVRLPGGGISTNPSLIIELTEPQSNWQHYSLQLADFLEKVTSTECLAHVDGIKITVDSNYQLKNGETERFNLYVDDIELVPKIAPNP
jgi:hypothetical protein